MYYCKNLIDVTRRSPLAVDDIAATDEDTPVNFNVLANDVDDDILPETSPLLSKRTMDRLFIKETGGKIHLHSISMAVIISPIL